MRRAWFLLSALGLLSCKTEESGDPGPDPVNNPSANADGDCLTDAEERELGTDPADANGDADADTLLDCDEVARGSNPTAADSDGDGAGDGEEVACVSSPIDGAEKCYACGWKHNDPGDLVATGKDVGNVIGNMQIVDQCLETVSLWDFAATPKSPMPEPRGYHILFMTAAW
jgi:hypothetical protein